MQDKIIALVDTHLKGTTREETLRKDIASHYLLRLGYCLTEDKRKWFLTQECDLFRARFRVMLPADQRAFMESSKLPFHTCTREEFDEIKDSLTATTLAITNSLQQAQAITQGSSPHETFYKVPFETVPDLVASRRVYLSKGFAYVSRDQVSSLVVQPFRSMLSKALVRLSRDWNGFLAKDEADRLGPLVQGISQRYLGPDYSDPSKRGPVGVVNAGDIPRLAQESFPLCMMNMISTLHDQHHLKHIGRMQLGLFLKGIGLPLEEAIKFWRMEMAQHAPGEKFDKQYLYNIRHNYGKEGKRQEYTPHSCQSIISTIPGAGQTHGCPYRTMNEDGLRAALGRLSVAPAKAEEAVKKAAAGHYQLACASAWEGKMGCSCDSGINHPNQYYEESRKVLVGDVEDNEETMAAAVGEGDGYEASAAAAALTMTPGPTTVKMGGGVVIGEGEGGDVTKVQKVA